MKPSGQSFRSQSFRPLPIDIKPAHTQKQLVIGYVLAALGAAFFSLKAIFIKSAYDAMPALDALTLMAIRMGISVPIYIVILVWALRRRAKQPQYKNKNLTLVQYLGAVLIGLIGYYIASYLDFTGLQHVTAQLERLILYTYPGFIMILGALFFGKRLSIKGVLYMMLAYSGLVLIFARGEIASGEHIALGSMLVVGAAFSFALFQLLAAKQITIFGSALFTCVAMLGAGAGILIHYAAREISGDQFSTLMAMPTKVWLIGVGIAVVSTLLPSFMINIALGRIGALAVSILGMFSPIVTTILAVTILHEPFSIVDGFGTLLTLIGIALFTLHQRKVQNMSIDRR